MADYIEVTFKHWNGVYGKYRTKNCKVYGKRSEPHILYKGIEIPIRKLIKMQDGTFEFNCWLYFRLDEDEYDEHFGIR